MSLDSGVGRREAQSFPTAAFLKGDKKRGGDNGEDITESGIGPPVELNGRHASGLLNLIGLAKLYPARASRRKSSISHADHIEPAGFLRMKRW